MNFWKLWLPAPFAENINDRVKALEQSAGTHEETGAANRPR
jgi:hypothetical protein